MASDDLALNWNDHYSVLTEVFENLLGQNSLTDCTIAAEGQSIKAHKLILSACSPYFELLFSEDSEKYPIVILKDIKFKELKAMIDFMYRGQVRIPSDQLQDFVDAAESLQIKGLGVDLKGNISGKKNELDHSRRKDQITIVPIKRAKVSCGNGEENKRHSEQRHPVSNSEKEARINHPSHVDSYNSKCAPLLHPSSSASCTVSKVKVEKSSDEESPRKYSHSEDMVEKMDYPHLPVTTELQEMPLVFIPESDGMIDPKEEVCVEDEELDTEDGFSQAEYNEFHNQESMRQYSSSSMPIMPETRLNVGTSNVGEHIGENAAVPGPGVAWSSRGLVMSAVGPSSAAIHLPQPVLDFPAHHSILSTGGDPAPSAYRPLGQRLPRRGAKGPKPKRHACLDCGRMFSSTSVLRRHIRRHTGERPFACSLCGAAFTRLAHLQAHSSVHTGEKAYSCDLCGKSFSHKESVFRHKRKVHKLPPDIQLILDQSNSVVDSLSDSVNS